MASLYDLLSGQEQGRNPLHEMLTQQTGELTAYQPSLRDRIAYALSDAAGYAGAGRYAQQDIADKARNVIDFVPGLGELLGADDVATSLDAGNYRNAAINLGATALGVIPVVGDAAAKSAKNYAYHRFTRGAHPDNGVGYMMFAEGSPERVNHYGGHHWAIDPAEMPAGSVIDASDPAVQADFAKMLHDNWDEVELRGYGYSTPEQLAGQLAPDDIVDAAQFWDGDLTNLAWEQFFEPRGVLGVKTPDGMIAFDPSFVRRVED